MLSATGAAASTMRCGQAGDDEAGGLARAHVVEGPDPHHREPVGQVGLDTQVLGRHLAGRVGRHGGERGASSVTGSCSSATAP